MENCLEIKFIFNFIWYFKQCLKYIYIKYEIVLIFIWFVSFWDLGLVCVEFYYQEYDGLIKGFVQIICQENRCIFDILKFKIFQDFILED